jgi:hypothetical protein
MDVVAELLWIRAVSITPNANALAVFLKIHLCKRFSTLVKTADLTDLTKEYREKKRKTIA